VSLSRLDDEYASVRLEAVDTLDKPEPLQLLKYEAAVACMLYYPYMRVIVDALADGT